MGNTILSKYLKKAVGHIDGGCAIYNDIEGHVVN